VARVVLDLPAQPAHVHVERRYGRLADWADAHAGLHRVTHRWSAHDMSTPDLLPYIGRYLPGTKNLWVATGFGQWGMTGGTAAGHVLAARILGEPHPAADLFDPNRFDARSVLEVAQDNLTVAKYLVGDHVAALWRSEKLDDLRPGEAEEHVDGGRLARAVGPEQGHGLTCRHLEVDSVDRPDRPVGPDQAFEADTAVG